MAGWPLRRRPPRDEPLPRPTVDDPAISDTPEERAPEPPPRDDPPLAEPLAREPGVATRVVGLQGHGVVALAVIVVVAALKLAEGFFIPLLLSVVIALALARIVRVLARWLPRWIASALVVLMLTGVGGVAAYSLTDEAARAIAELPRATRNLRQAIRVMMNRDQGPLSQLQRALTELQRTATEQTERPSTPSGVTAVQVVEPPIDLSNLMWWGSQGVLMALAQLILVLFLVYFLLAYGDLFKRKLVKLSGESLARRKITLQVIDQIVLRVARSISHLVLAGVVVGLSTWGALYLLHVPYAALWGLAAGLFNCIPYVGPAVVAFGLLMSTIVQAGDIGTALFVSGVSLAITTIEGVLFTPIVFGHAVRLNPVAIFVAFLFWGWLWGGWGMVLALPLLMIIKTVADSVEDLAPLSEMLSD